MDDMALGPLAGHAGPRTPDELYASPPPWNINRPQPAFLALAQTGRWRGRVLDVGCGTGEHALLAASLGLDATGVDLSTAALTTATHKARQRGLSARFLHHDARDLPSLGETFDTVLDCGLFHIFAPADRSAFVASLRAATATGGRYFMLGFSDRQPGTWGPHRLSRDDVTAAFATGWHLHDIAAATLDITTDPAGVSAWLVTATAT